MKRSSFAVALVILVATSVPLSSASGPLGIYAIVEKVVLEPNETLPERIQVWGAFSYVEGPIPYGVMVVSRAQRGYMYFTLASRDGMPSEQATTTIRNEWKDLKTVAGTGQAVGFGSWPGGARENPPGPILGPAMRGAEALMRVRSATEKPEQPAPYMTNIGVVKLSDHGVQSWIVQQLRDALK